MTKHIVISYEGTKKKKKKVKGIWVGQLYHNYLNVPNDSLLPLKMSHTRRRK